MKITLKKLNKSLILLIIIYIPNLVSAHLMVDQNGTINFVNDKAFMVLSIATSAFETIDDDQDGKVSLIEFNKNRAEITELIKKHVSLSNEKEQLSMQGLMLSPVQSHNKDDSTISQLVVLAQYSLVNRTAQTFEFGFGLYGNNDQERTQKITITSDLNDEKKIFYLTPDAPLKKFLIP